MSNFILVETKKGPAAVNLDSVNTIEMVGGQTVIYFSTTKLTLSEEFGVVVPRIIKATNGPR